MRTAVMAAAMAAMAAAGCGGSGYGSDGTSPGGCHSGNATATTSVALTASAFVPSCVKIAPGSTITFTNDDVALHTVTTDAGQATSFDSGNLAQTQQFVRTFSAAGTVNVHCTYHVATGMRATIIVEVPPVY